MSSHEREASVHVRASSHFSLALNPVPVRRAETLSPDEYEECLAMKMEEEKAKLPPTPEVLPDLPYDLARGASEVAGGEYNEHYARAYKTLAAQRASFSEMSHSLRESMTETMIREARESQVKLSGWELHVKMTDQAQARALAKWEEQRQIWDDVKRKMSLASGKAIGDLAMERCDEYRKKLEALTHLDMAIPLPERDGEKQWAMSLRDNWTRYVSVGNIFSGLFIVKREKVMKNPLQVRRPHNPADGISYQQLKGRSMLDSQFMRQRRKKYDKHIKAMLPGEHGEDVAALELVGEAMEPKLADQGARDITLEDLEEQIAQDSLETWAAIQKFRADQVAAAAAASAAAAAAEAELEAAARAALGPHCHVSASRVAVVAAAATPGHATVTMRNTGTTALFYEWRRDAPAALKHAKGKGADAFYLADVSGSLLPGETREVMWTFKSERPGTFLDRWRLETRPALREGPVAPVTLKGTATAEDANSYPRRMLLAELARKEMVHKVTTAVGKVFGRVKTPPPTTARPLGAPSGPDAAAWAAGNAQRRPRVYYSEETYGALRATFSAAVAATASLEPPVPSEGEEAAAGEGAEEGAEEGAAADGTPDGWDGSVAAVEAAVDALAAAVEANPDWTPPEPDPTEVVAADGEETAPPTAPPPPHPREILETCRADLDAALRSAALPASRSGILYCAASEALAKAMDGMDAAAAAAREKHAPPPPPVTEEVPTPGEDGEEGGAEGVEEGAEEGAEPEWKAAYVQELSEAVAAMLGDAVDDFEFNRVAAVDEEVKAECDRRADAVEGAGEQREWDVYAILRQRKALLGREP